MISMNSPDATAPHILAIETSGRIGSVAVGCGLEVREYRQFSQSMRHAVELMPAIRELTRRQGWAASDINQVYVSIGPGSFTGVRIAISVARAISQATGARLVGVPTLDVLAANLPAGVRNAAVILDAKRGQVYAGRYTASDTAPPDPHSAPIGSARLLRTAGPVLSDPVEFIRQCPRPLLILGEGIPYHSEALAAAGIGEASVITAEKELWQPDARRVYELGTQLTAIGGFTALPDLLPIYIRKAEAEEVLEQKLQAAAATQPPPRGTSD